MKTIVHLLTIIAFVFAFYSNGFSQGILRGKVTDQNGESLIGATVIEKANPSNGTITDFDGNFSLKIEGAPPQTIIISYVSYNTIEESVSISNGQVLIRNYTMESASVTLDDVVITARANRADNTYMERVKMGSPVSLDYISAETIRQIGDSDIQSAVKRITGVSTVGSFVTVRGLADRYNKSTINSARIPTLDPFTNNIKLDMFPTSLIDNLVISKTMSPDLPGDWSGAFISIETKDYPNKLSLNVSSTFGYNSQSTFKNIISSRRSSTDWLGFDSDFRDIDHFDRLEFPQFNQFPTPYQSMSALGLSDFFDRLGIDDSYLGTGSEQSVYYRLALVELGILPPAFFYTSNEINKAINMYRSDYLPGAVQLINQKTVEFGTNMPTNWSVIQRTAPLDFSQEFSLGNQTTLFGQPLGYIFGVKYNMSSRYDPNALLERAIQDTGNPDIYIFQNYSDEQQSQETFGWNVLFKTAYKFNPNHSISIMFMPNIEGENNARYSISPFSLELDNEINEEQIYEERQQLIYQLGSTHYFPATRIRVDLEATYTDAFSNIPDYKSLTYFRTDELPEGGYEWAFDNRSTPNRYYRYLEEDLTDIKGSLEIPFLKKESGLTRNIKIGSAYTNNNRDFAQYEYRVLSYFGTENIPDGNISKFLSQDKFDFTEEGILPLYYVNDTSFTNWARNNSTGHSKVYAGYGMLDFEITSRVRVAGGLRIEQTDIFSDSKYLEGLPQDHILRERTGFGSTFAKAAYIDRLDYLPSVNLILKLISQEKISINGRFNYYKSLGRPSIREVTYAYVYDYENRSHVLGNPGLKMVEISNYDARFEAYFQNGDNFSVSVFYKDFTNHIELFATSGFLTWRNAEESTAFGIEIEGKKSLGRSLELRANLTIIESETKFMGPIGWVTQKMFGQAPYIVNTLLGYNSDRLGLSASVSYNVQGERLVIAPDIYELPMHNIDLKISKRISDHFSVSAKVRNLLNSSITRAYDFDDWKYRFDRYTYGTNYSLSISYNI